MAKSIHDLLSTVTVIMLKLRVFIQKFMLVFFYLSWKSLTLLLDWSNRARIPLELHDVLHQEWGLSLILIWIHLLVGNRVERTAGTRAPRHLRSSCTFSSVVRRLVLILPHLPSSTIPTRDRTRWSLFSGSRSNHLLVHRYALSWLSGNRGFMPVLISCCCGTRLQAQRCWWYGWLICRWQCLDVHRYVVVK